MATKPTVFDFRTSTAYFEGNFVPFAQATVSIASSPVLYGLGVYTVFGASWNAHEQRLYAFRLRDHYRRLVESCRIMGFAPFDEMYSYEEFEELVQELLQRNTVLEDVLVRVALYIDELIAGTRISGLKTGFSMYVYPLGEFLPRAGIHVGISSWAKPGDNAIPPRAKITGGYAGSSLMKQEALHNGYDEALALDSTGHVAEATAANVFMVRNGTLITPDRAHDILEGITRNSIFALAGRLGIPCEAAQIDRTELYIADEVFLCGSSAGVVPVLSVDRRPIGDGRPGPLTTKLMAEYGRARIGETPESADWLTLLRTPKPTAAVTA